MDDAVESQTTSPQSIEVTDTFLERFEILSCEEQLSQCISVHSKTHHNMDLPDDFIQFCLSAMKNLDSHGKTNVLYRLAMGLGSVRPDSSDSVFPITRMPFGLLDHMVNFFISTRGTNVSFSPCITMLVTWLLYTGDLFKGV